MPQVPPGQRAAQRPDRAATAVSRALGRAVTGGFLTEELLVFPDGGQPFRIHLDDEGGEVHTPLAAAANRNNEQQGADDA